MPEGFISDIYDGDMWKRFNSSDGYNFLSSPHCYLLILNVDWFEPFEHGVYSIGAIYLTIQNLPRNERYKPQNIIIVGVLPGPREPKKTINTTCYRGEGSVVQWVQCPPCTKYTSLC